MLIIYFHLSADDPHHITQAVYDYDYSKEVVIGDNMNVDSVILGKMHPTSKRFFDQSFKPGSYRIFHSSNEGGKKIFRVAPVLE